MYLLDTDTYSLLWRGNVNIVRRIAQLSPSDIFVSDVSVAELLRGRLATIKTTERDGGDRLIAAYRYLRQLLEAIQTTQIASYTAECDALYSTYDAKTRRIGANDCRIAAIAQTLNFTVVTANTRHFEAIGCQQEDWSLA